MVECLPRIWRARLFIANPSANLNRCWRKTSPDTDTSSLTSRIASAPRTPKATNCSRRFAAAKKVILVSATPLNNSPQDILSQIKLFQPAKNSSNPRRPQSRSVLCRLAPQFERPRPSGRPRAILPSRAGQRPRNARKSPQTAHDSPHPQRNHGILRRRFEKAGLEVPRSGQSRTAPL